MKKVKGIKITTMNYKCGFMVDIVEKPEEFEAWLYHEKNGIKDFLFGVPKQQNGNTEDFNSFVSLVESNLEDETDLEYYCNEYMDGYLEDYMKE